MTFKSRTKQHSELKTLNRQTAAISARIVRARTRSEVVVGISRLICREHCGWDSAAVWLRGHDPRKAFLLPLRDGWRPRARAPAPNRPSTPRPMVSSFAFKLRTNFRLRFVFDLRVAVHD